MTFQTNLQLLDLLVEYQANHVNVYYSHLDAYELDIFQNACSDVILSEGESCVRLQSNNWNEIKHTLSLLEEWEIISPAY